MKGMSLAIKGSSVRHLKALVVAAFLISLLAGCASDRESRRNEAIAAQQLALAFLNEGRPARALTELAKAERALPDDPEVQNAMGLAYWARRDYANAEVRFLKAIKLKPSFSEAWNNLGAFYLSQGRNEEPVKALESALGNIYYSSYEMALSNLGLALYKLGRLPEARSRLEEAIEVNPTQPAVRLNLSLLLFDQGDYRQAKAHVDEALRIFPAYPRALLQKGKVLNKLGEREGAIEAFQEVWRIAPTTESGKSARTYLDFIKEE